MSKAVILGGTGVIGQAAARRLLAAGWQVDVCSRNPGRMPADLAAKGARHRILDRADASSLRSVLGDGADLLVDCLAFSAADARLVIPFLGSVGSTVMISSKAVYVDGAGRHVNSEVRPQFNGPISETNPTLAPGSGDHNTAEGYGPNKVAAEHTFLDSGHPVTVIRGSKVHGQGAAPAREWYFVKRILDGRSAIFLRNGGRSIDHTSAAVNLAVLIETVAGLPGSRVLNGADPDAPTVLEIARTAAGHFRHSWAEVFSEGDSTSDVGRTPWDTASPIVLDMSAAAKLGYIPVGTYAQTVAETLDWLAGAFRKDGAGAQDLPFFEGRFDYAAEDEYLKILTP
ncbi:NAD-dependent epimerase/dehydratase family protein [Arthrobacter sp.]|uniref:NAD-dependent epimerase/dehydratase family protein n=1 Tax=Arthrobacter sp. TaxID=1667 RepID=UPI002810ED15|nr:NAD-dependent epimerase/dehydratase family protein [Arthrobacter sp.]